MITAAVCPRCFAYRYRTEDLDRPPTSLDFAPLTPQVSAAADGQKAVCDICAGDLKFVRGHDWPTMQAQIAATSNGAVGAIGSGVRVATRISTAPAAITELFRADRDEEVRSMKDLPGDRILVVTSRRIVIVDPNLAEGGSV